MLAGLFFLQGQVISCLQVADLTNGEAEQIRCPEVGIDAQCEQTEIPWLVFQQGFDRLDVLDILDGVHLDGGTLGWPVDVLSFLHWLRPPVPAHYFTLSFKL